VKPPPRPRRTAISPSRSSTATAARTGGAGYVEHLGQFTLGGQAIAGTELAEFQRSSHLVDDQLVGWNLAHWAQCLVAATAGMRSLPLLAGYRTNTA